MSSAKSPSDPTYISASASKLIPSDAATVMVIRDITPNLTTLSVPFARFGRLRIGGRATIVKLQTGALAVFNPVALTPAAESTVASKGGQVKYIAALDFEHHIFLGPWAKKYPSAEVIGMEGLPEKREKDPGTKGTAIFKHVFTAANKNDYKIGSDEFDNEFSYEYVPSHGNKELVFFHKPTGTVIEADLLFNLPPTEQYSKAPDRELVEPGKGGILQRLFYQTQSLQGTAVWQKRLHWYLIAGRDRKGFSDSVKRMSNWDIKRIIPAHGDVIENDAQGEWNKVFEWFLKMP